MKRAALVLAALVGVAFLATTAANGNPTPTPNPPLGRDVKPVSVREMPSITGSHLVWRNGRYHNVKFKVKVTLETLPDGSVREVQFDDSADVEAQLAKLPPPMPALDKVGPTEEQFEAAMEAAGLKLNADGTPAPPPPPPGAKTGSGKITDPVYQVNRPN